MKRSTEESRVPGNMNGANRHARYFSSTLFLPLSFSPHPIITTAFLFLRRSTKQICIGRSSCTRLRACQPTHQRRRHRRLDIYVRRDNESEPEPSAFPRAAWNKVLSAASNTLLQYQIEQASLDHRNLLIYRRSYIL